MNEIEVLKQAGDAGRRLLAREQDLREQDRAALKRKAAIRGGPEPADVVVATMRDLVDGAAAAYQQEHGHHIVDVFSSTLKPQGNGETLRTERARLWSPPGFLTVRDSSAHWPPTWSRPSSS